MYLKSFITASLYFLSLGLHASIISTDDYTNDVNNEVFWTNHELGLDIMRLSYSDTITASGDASTTQATVETIEAFLAQDDTGWGWATDLQFEDIYHWFDTDPNATGWTADQNEGTSLFFELNGVGTAYAGDGNNGYSTSGRQFWYSLIKTDSVTSQGKDPEAHLRNIIMDTYADGIEANCTHSSRCGKSKHSGDITGWIQTQASSNLGAETVNDPFNHAALLVRINVQGNGNVNELPEPKSIVWFSLLLCGLIYKVNRTKRK